MPDKSFFTLDLNEEYTRISDIKLKKDKIEVLSLGYDATAPFFYANENEQISESQTQIISRLQSNLKIKQKNVNIVIPDIYTYSQILEMPKLKEKELLAAIRYQADEFIPMSLDETYLDLEVLKEDEKTKKMLIFIVASPKKIVEQIQHVVQFAGLNPIGLENELSVMGRFCSIMADIQALPSERKATIILNVGYNSTSIYLLDRSNYLITSVRTFKVGYSLFVKDIKVNLNWPEEKAIEALKTIGGSENGSYNLDTIVDPIIKEMSREIQKMVTLAQEKYSLVVDQVQTYNHDNLIADFQAKIQSSVNITTVPFPIANVLEQNPVVQSFSSSITSYTSAIAGNLE